MEEITTRRIIIKTSGQTGVLGVNARHPAAPAATACDSGIVPEEDAQAPQARMIDARTTRHAVCTNT